MEPNDRKRGSETKLKYREFQSNIRKSFYTVRRLPGKVVGAASFALLKSHLNVVLSSQL